MNPQTKVRTQIITVVCACCDKSERAEYLASVNPEDIVHLCRECSQWFERQAAYELPSLGY